MKTAIICTVVVGTNVIGNYALKLGLTQVGGVEAWSPVPYLKAFMQPWVAVGIVFMLSWLAARLAFLSWADLSFVLPVTSFTYVFTAVVAAVYLDERVTAIHWAGICVITIGVALVAHTRPGTTDHPQKKAERKA